MTFWMNVLATITALGIVAVIALAAFGAWALLSLYRGDL